MAKKNNNVSLKEICLSSGLVFGGIDYGLGKMIGQDFNDPNNIVHYMFGAWNDLFYKEANKYDVFKALKTSGNVDLSIVEKSNQSVDPNSIRTNIIPVISRSEIQKHVENYSFINKEGYAIVFIHEFYCKPYQNASYWVVVIEKSTNLVVWAKPIKVIAKGGFGFKNYWATTILNLILEIKKRQKTWEKR